MLEFLAGEDLSQWMLRPHTLREQVQVMQDLAQAIAAAHKVGVLHRDLKPENARVLGDGRCKLLDFGIAQSGAGQLTASGYFVGTPEFVAPEVMSGAPHTPAADIYALGLLWYTMLCGANPFRGDTVQATVARVVQLEPPLLSKRVTGVPVELERLIHACLAKQPESRPASADALVQALGAQLVLIAPDARVGEAPVAVDTAPYPITPAPSKTHASAIARPGVPKQPRPRAGWALAVALLVAGATGAWWLLQSSPPEPPAVAVQSLPPAEPATRIAEPAAGPAPETVAPADSGSPATATDAGQPPEPAASPVEETAVAAIEDAEPPSTAAAGPAPSDRTGTDVESRGAAPPTAPAATGRAAGHTEAPAPTAVAEEPASAPVPASPPVAAPPPILDRQPSPAPEVAVASVASPPQLVEVTRYSPRVLRAGRQVTVRVEGIGLKAVTAVAIDAGGVADTRFRVGAIEHSGDRTLQFSLNIARGVPLGTYALLLRGEGVRAEPILLEISL